MNPRRHFFAALLSGALAAGALASAPALAEDTTAIVLTLKDHKFQPAEVKAPAKKPIVITVKNLDTTPAEFESKDLKLEKVVKGGAEITLNVRALSPGKYKFFDEYNEKTAVGYLIVE
ncbi:MAG: cupredoxin domain-containing protein [Beijerinckiaceae bacterium]